MGAESSILDDYKISEPLIKQQSNGQPWTIRPAYNSKGTKVTIFIHQRGSNETSGQISLENAIKLKLLRHPCILKYYESFVNHEEIEIVTEEVMPLTLVIDSLQSDDIVVGLHEILQALTFLHDRGSAAHNNICSSSIFVSQVDGSWKLGAVEYMSSFNDVNAKFLKETAKYRCADCISPEEKSGKAELSPAYGYCRDAYAFGTFVLSLKDRLNDVDNSVISQFLDHISQTCLAKDPKKRSKLNRLMKEEIFVDNGLLEIVTFLTNITLKISGEKQEFFRHLARRLFRYSSTTIIRRLLKMLLSRFVLAEPFAATYLFPHLLATYDGDENDRVYVDGKINPIISLDLFKKEVIPIVVKLFKVKHKHVRLLILDHFSSYVRYFNRQQLQKEVLPKILQGLRDMDNEIVAATFRAMADCVLVLGAENVVGTADRRIIFKEGQPDFFKPCEAIPHNLSRKDSSSSYEASPYPDHLLLQNMVQGSNVVNDEFKEDATELVGDSLTSPDNAVQSSESVGAVDTENCVGDSSPEAVKKLQRERRREEARKRNEEKKKQRRMLQTQKQSRNQKAEINVNRSNATPEEKYSSDVVTEIEDESNSSQIDNIKHKAFQDIEAGDSEKGAWSSEDWENLEEKEETVMNTISKAEDSTVTQPKGFISTSITKDRSLSPTKTTNSVSSIRSSSQVQKNTVSYENTSEVNDVEDSGNEDNKKGWQSWDVPQPLSPAGSTSSSNTSKALSTSRKLTSSSGNDSLARTFEIQVKAVDPSEEIDYFADMQPVYAAAKSVRATGSTDKKEEETNLGLKKQALFDIRQTEDSDTAASVGWDDNWETDDLKS